MANTSKTIMYVGIAAGIAVVLGIIVFMMSKSGSNANTAKKTANATAKTAAQAAASAKNTVGVTPAALASAIQTALGTKQAAVAANGGKNPDGSTPVAGATPKTKVPMTTVDAAGDYIENGDPTTLYNQNGDVIGDLNADTGFFENSNGIVVAACDGTPIAKMDENDNYMEPDGQWYESSGIPITKNGDGTYIESGDSVDVFNPNGDVIGTLDSDGLTYVNNSTGQQFVLTSGRLIGLASQINSYNADGSVDYIDGTTLSGDGMTLEYPNGTLVDTGGKQVAWYNGSTGDITYAAIGTRKVYTLKPKSMATGNSADNFYAATGSGIVGVMQLDKLEANIMDNLIPNILAQGVNSGFSAYQLQQIVKLKNFISLYGYLLQVTDLATIQAVLSGNKNQAMLNAYNAILTRYKIG